MSSNILKSQLLHASGKQMVMLGGDVFDQKVMGDIVVEHKWVDGEPVTLLYKRILGSNTPAYMVEMKDAWKFVQSNGYATKELIKELAHGAAEALRCENDKSSIFRIIDALVYGIEVMLKMPPEPLAIEIANRPTTGNDELSLKIDGKTIFEAQL